MWAVETAINDLRIAERIQALGVPVCEKYIERLRISCTMSLRLGEYCPAPPPLRRMPADSGWHPERRTEADAIKILGEPDNEGWANRVLISGIPGCGTVVFRIGAEKFQALDYEGKLADNLKVWEQV
jgi:hypothetical protein